MAKVRHVVLYSGGLDSYITWVRIRERYSDAEVVPVYYDLGHRYAFEERIAVMNTVPVTKTIEALRSLGQWEEDGAYIHHRNLFLVAAASKEIDKSGYIWLTVQKDEMSLPDRSVAFFKASNEMFKALGQTIVVDSPWISMDKTEMVQWYLHSGYAKEELTKTWSCYRPSRAHTKHCGDCPACFRRAIALSANRVYESYLVNPFHSTTAKIYRRRALNGVYSDERCKRILEVVRE